MCDVEQQRLMMSVLSMLGEVNAFERTSAYGLGTHTLSSETHRFTALIFTASAVKCELNLRPFRYDNGDIHRTSTAHIGCC